jgi:capsular exopolysaccharide synthesis family protein
MDQRLPLSTERGLARLAPPPGASLASGFAPDPRNKKLKGDTAGLLDYWRMVRKRRFTVIVAAVIGALLGFLYAVPQARIYQARTTIEVQGLNEDFLGMRNVTPTVSPTSNDYPDFDIQTQVKILQSRSLLKQVIEDLRNGKRPADLRPPNRLATWKQALGIHPQSQHDLWEEALDVAAGSVRIRASGTNRIVEISCDSTQPAVAAAFANTLTREFIQQNLEARWKSTEYTGEWLGRQLQDIKIKLEKDEDELNTYARVAGLTFADEKTNVDEDKLRGLQKDLLAAEDDRIAKQSKYEMAKSSPPETLPDVLDDATLRSYEANLTDLRRQYAQLRVNFKDTHPDVRRIQVQIGLMETTLESERGHIMNRIRNEFESADRREKMLAASYADQLHLVGDQAVKTSHYSILKREVDSARQLYDTMLQRLKEASVASALRASNIRVVDPAELPELPYKPNVPRFLITGLLLGCFCGFALIVFQEKADRTLHEPGDTATYLHLPELAAIPAASVDLSPRGLRMARRSRGLFGSDNHREADGLVNDRVELLTWSRRHSLVAEAFRGALTSILFSSRTGERPRVLVLTSASPGEGKTTVVSNLALALAEINQKVLIIDADLRRPRIHEVFGLCNDGIGLSEQLLDPEHVDLLGLTSCLRKTQITGLHILPSGCARINAASLLHSERLGELIWTLRDRFDTILIDTPPVVNVPDARVIARHADGVVLVFRSAVTTRDAALMAKQRFCDDGISIMGTILNDWNPKTQGYSEYGKYYTSYLPDYEIQNSGESQNGAGKSSRAKGA